jgi:hypothetical protein
MALISEGELAHIREHFVEKIPPAMQDEVRLTVDFRGDRVMVRELRAPWDPEITEWSESNVAQLQRGDDGWILSCSDGDGRWHEFGPHPTGTLDELLVEIDEDSTGIFWG